MKIPEPLEAPIQGLAIGVLLIMIFFTHSVFFNILGVVITLSILYVLTKTH